MKITPRIAKAIISIMAFGVLNGQTFLGHRIAPLPETEPVYDVDENRFIKKIYQEYDTIEGRTPRLQDYALECVNEKLKLKSSGYEYEGLEDLQDYVEKVISRLSFSSGADTLQVRFVRDASPNAFAFEDGTIYIHPGIMRIVNNEAQLAALLGHEISHIRLHHNFARYKDFLAFQQHANAGISIGGIGGLILFKYAKKQYSSHSVEEETSADNFALNALLKSPYHSTAAASLHNNFLRQKEILATRKSFTGHRAYIKTHPPSEMRVEGAIKFAKKDTLIKKNWNADTLAFENLRRFCLDESIRLLFFDYEFEDCLELAYQQHVLAPEDPFYIFFIRQCLIRLRAQKPELSNKRFLTERYNVKAEEFRTVKPSYIYSKFYRNAPARFVIAQTVFYQMDAIYPLFDSAAFKKPLGLLKHDTLEFINYEDALEYSGRKANELGCKLCFADSVQITEENLTKEELEIAGLIADRTAEEYAGNKKVFVIARYQKSDYTPLSGYKLGSDDQGNYKNIYSNLKTDPLLSAEYLIPDELSFTDRNTITKYLDNIRHILPDQNENETSSGPKTAHYYNFNCIMPELGALMRKYKLNKLNYLSVVEIAKRPSGIAGAFVAVYEKVIHCYSIDYRNNTVAKLRKNLGKTTDAEVLYEALNVFEGLNKMKAWKTR